MTTSIFLESWRHNLREAYSRAQNIIYGNSDGLSISKDLVTVFGTRFIGILAS